MNNEYITKYGDKISSIEPKAATQSDILTCVSWISQDQTTAFRDAQNLLAGNPRFVPVARLHMTYCTLKDAPTPLGDSFKPALRESSSLLREQMAGMPPFRLELSDWRPGLPNGPSVLAIDESGSAFMEMSRRFREMLAQRFQPLAINVPKPMRGAWVTLGRFFGARTIPITGKLLEDLERLKSFRLSVTLDSFEIVHATWQSLDDAQTLYHLDLTERVDSNVE